MRHFLIGLGLLAILLAGMTSNVFAAQTLEVSEAQSGVSLLNQSDQGVTLKIDIGQIEFYDVATKEGNFTLATIPGFSRSFKVGEPNLPVVNRILQIPFGSEISASVESYDVSEYSLADLGVDNWLMPVQPSLSKSDDPESVPFEFNQPLYEIDQFYSLPLAQSEVLGTMRDMHMGMVKIAPVQYNPITHTLRVYHNIQVRIDFTGADWALQDEMVSKYHSPMFKAIYNKAINYSESTLGNKDDLVTYPVKYVIVSDRMFEAQLQPFIEWKIKKGFTVEVAYTDVIGSSTTAIGNYIETLYNNANPPTDPAPSFVLFVGDDQQIPAHDLGAHISDLPYCEFTNDNFPEIYYGRFSAQNTTQLQPQIDKTLEYEMYTMPDPSYLAEVTLIAGVDGTFAITHGNGQINYGTNLYFNAAHGITPNTWLYPASDGSGVPAAVIQTVNDGIGLINYTAHCGHTGHSDPSFTTSDVSTLTNAHKYNLGIGNCCLANTFGADYSTPCMGEAWLQKQDGGGIGYIGGTNSTYWDEDYWWGVGYGPVVGAGPTYAETGLGAYDGVFHDHGEPVSQHYVTNSAIMFAGNMAVTESGSSRIAYYWQIYHLMGDPSVISYMGVPTVNNYTLPATILITDNQVYIEADPGSYVGLSRNGVLHGAGLIDATGAAYIDIDPFIVPGEIDIVITAQNRIPVTETAMVIAPDGPYVIHDTHDINDIAGNNNGTVEIGESILLGMQLKNVGPDDAINVSTTISTADPYVTITDDTEVYGTVLGNDGTNYIADAFAFDVSSSTPDGHKVSFDVTVTGDQRITWESNFSINVHAPVLSFVSVDVNDNSGNGNGILDPGETAQLVITLDNSGSGDAENLSALLSETDMFVTVSDNSAQYGTIASGMSGDNTSDVFIVEADASCPMGYAMQFQLDLSAYGGYAETLYFDFTVGDRIVFHWDDFATDQGWTGLGGSGEWTIGSCQGGDGGSGVGDPANDHTPTADNMVLGNDLNGGSGGDYNSGLSSTYWVYSPIIDCEDYSGIQMKYYHWLGVESSNYDHAIFEVYNGTEWVRLFENSGSVDESSWTESFYDLSIYADENMNFQMRWGIGPTDGSVTYCGWNIDDIELKGYYNGNEYKVRVSPEEMSQYGPAGDYAVYPIIVRNRGAFMDNFSLGSEGDWDVVFYDELGQNEITSTGQVGSLDSTIIQAWVNIPDTIAMHDCDTNLVIVTSQGDALAKDSATLITYSAGLPAAIPWDDQFVTSNMDMQQWFYNAGATINDDCLEPPTEPYALNLDGGTDTVTTGMIDLSGQSGVRISYYYQRGGGGDAPEENDNLWIEYKNNMGLWANLATYAGADPVMEQFEYVNVEAPADALHSGFQLRLRTAGSGANDDDWFVDNIIIDYAPELGTLPSMMAHSALQGDTLTDQFVIENTGQGGMYYDLSIQYHMMSSVFAALSQSGQVEPANREYSNEFYQTDLGKEETPVLKGQDVKFNAGGPDNYGYYWMDSDEAGGPVFNWIDISAVGTDVVSQLEDDNAIGPFDIGFDFPYYGQTYNQFYIGSNGIVGFSAASMSSRNETPLPNSYAPNNILAWLWNDLDPTDADNPDAHVYYHSDGEELVIMFVDYPEYRADPGDVVTAEIILDDKGNIKFQYLDIADNFDSYGCAVGIENEAGNDGLEVVYHAAYLKDNLAIQFSKPYEWMHLDPLSGYIAPGEADTIDCLITTELDLLPGTYNADINLSCNDPANLEALIMAQLELSGMQTYTCGDSNGDDEINVSDAVYIINYVFVNGTPPDPMEAADVNCDGEVNVSDGVSIINNVFVGGFAPCDPNNDGVPDC